jgi:hypothetical protein
MNYQSGRYVINHRSLRICNVGADFSSVHTPFVFTLVFLCRLSCISFVFIYLKRRTFCLPSQTANGLLSIKNTKRVAEANLPRLFIFIWKLLYQLYIYFCVGSSTSKATVTFNNMWKNVSRFLLHFPHFSYFIRTKYVCI